jgi:CRP-like cAMP-binding protein
MASLDYSDYLAHLRDNPLFQDLREEELARLVAVLPAPVTYPGGALVVQEGESADSMFILLNGSAEVLKQSLHAAEQIPLAELQAGQTLGEMFLLDQGVRSATVRTREDSLIGVIPFALLQQVSEGQSTLLDRIKLQVAAITGQRFRTGNEATVEVLAKALDEAQKRSAMSGFISKVLLACCAYIYGVGLFNHLELNDSTYVTLPMALIWLGLVVHMVLRNGYALEIYGITLRNWRLYALQGLFWALLLIGCLILIKWALIVWVDAYREMALLDFSRSIDLSGSALLISFVVYAFIIAPFEELVRGGMQGTMQHLMTGSNTKFRANLLCNIVFSAIHVHLSMGMTLLVFPVGMLWGRLFARQGSVVGPIVCHILLGSLAFFVVGIP